MLLLNLHSVPPRRHRPFALHAAYLAAAFLLAAPAAGSDEPREILAPGTAVERPLAAGGAAVLDVELDVGRPWRVRVEKLGIDVVVEVRDAAGDSLLKVSSPAGREGTESLLLRPAAAGTYRIEVRSTTPGAADGRVVLRLDELPDVTTEDRLRLRAEQALSDAGRLHAMAQAGAGENALDRLREALDAWSELGERREEARTLLLVGRHLDALNDARQAVASYDRALALWRELGDPGGVAACLDRLGLARVNLGEFPPAVSLLEESLVLRQRLGRREREAETLNLLGLALQKAGRFGDAAERYEQALALAREIDDTEMEARLLNNLGGIFQNLGEPARELEYLQQALELQRAIGSAFGEAAALNNLGPYYRRLGDVETALRYYSQALAIFERLGERRWQARTLNNIGFAYLTVHELELARAYFLRALPLWREVGDKANETVTLLNLGRAFSGLDQEGRALAYFKKALENSLATGNRRYTTSARQRLGEFYLAQGEPAAARRQLETALADLRERGQRSQEAEVLELLGRVHLALGDPRVATTLAAEALGLHGAARQPAGEVAARATLARARIAEQQLAAGREQLEAALETLEKLHGQIADPGQRASFLSSQREVYELYVDVLMQLHRRSPGQGHDLAALAASERGRSRSLLALLEGVALNGVRAELRQRDPRHAALGPSETLDAAAVRALLDDETVLLEYLLGEERSYLWWVTSTAISTYVLPPREEVEALAVEVYERLSNVHQRTGGVREDLHALGEMLLGPVAEKLRDQRLAIVADGALHFVSFGALSVPGSGGLPLLARHEVVYLPSASVLASQRQRRGSKRPTQTVAILADPIFGRQDPRVAMRDADSANRIPGAVLRSGLAELGRLTHTRREAEAIASLVAPDERLVALDGAARRSRVVDGELAKYRILHFATHGLVDSQNPELTGLVLSQRDADGVELDGFLGLRDVSSLELAAELVVLSGCRTALGKRVRGEGLVGLTRGFMIAGAPRVAASFWQVRDQATAELMERFYRALLTEKLTPAAALRVAQLALREERRFRDPFYWAAFALQGDWR